MFLVLHLGIKPTLIFCLYKSFNKVLYVYTSIHAIDHK
jgi:hypothetical protein